MHAMTGKSRDERRRQGDAASNFGPRREAEVSPMADTRP
jgi:hypothetical protein